MPVQRSLYLAAGAIGAPVGLSMSAIAPVAGVLAGVIAVGLLLLVTAAGALLVTDWRTEVESRRAWAKVAPVLGEWNSAARKQVEAVETRYMPAFDTDALREVFRMHRFPVPRPAAVVELPDASSAQPIPTQSASTRIASEAAQRSLSGEESDIGVALRESHTDQATAGTSRATPAKNMTVVAGGQGARSYSALDHSRVRLVVNARSNWLASDGVVLRHAAPSHTASVIVLTSCGDARVSQFPGATVTISATDTQPPSCRGPPTLEQRRSARRAPVAARRAAQSPNVSSDPDPVMLDNLGQPVPVCAAEMNVIETYLEGVLEELLESPKASSEPDRA